MSLTCDGAGEGPPEHQRPRRHVGDCRGAATPRACTRCRSSRVASAVHLRCETRGTTRRTPRRADTRRRSTAIARTAATWPSAGSQGSGQERTPARGQARNAPEPRCRAGVASLRLPQASPGRRERCCGRDYCLVRRLPGWPTPPTPSDRDWPPTFAGSRLPGSEGPTRLALPKSPPPAALARLRSTRSRRTSSGNSGPTWRPGSGNPRRSSWITA